MNLNKSNKQFVSPIQQFLRDFNHSNAKTPSQLAEIAKHRSVFEKRDKAQEEEPTLTFWENF